MGTKRTVQNSNRIKLATTEKPGSVLDLTRLVETRLLIQGGSGSGKSTLARRILEQTSGALQQIVIDPEGEFRTLRKIGDYLLCSKDGDIPTDVKSAAMLAKRIRQSGVSAVVDIYELKPHERQLFVSRFLEGLMSTPKKYWRDALLFIDETHMFAPQARSSECLIAVQDTAARGRKRRLGLICATQRLSKLHKDVAAELQNRLIGQTGLKNDLRSAADDMGLSYAETRTSLVALKPGQFWAFGPAIAPEYTLFQAAQTKTQAATAETKTARASASLSKVIKSLSDLPKQAAKAAQTLADLKTDNTKLKQENTRLTKAADKKGIDENEVKRRIREALTSLPPAKVTRDDQKIVRLAEQIINETTGQTKQIPMRDKITPPIVQILKLNRDSSIPIMGKGEQKVLIAIAQHESGVDREQVTILTGYKPSTRNQYIQRLQVAGLIDVGPPIIATDEGVKMLPTDFEPLPTGKELRDYWINRLPLGERTILLPIIEAYPNSVSREQLSIETGYKPSTRNQYIQRLQTRKLINISGGEIVAHAHLFD